MAWLLVSKNSKTPGATRGPDLHASSFLKDSAPSTCLGKAKKENIIFNIILPSALTSVSSLFSRKHAF